MVYWICLVVFQEWRQNEKWTTWKGQTVHYSQEQVVKKKVDKWTRVWLTLKGWNSFSRNNLNRNNRNTIPNTTSTFPFIKTLASMTLMITIRIVSIIVYYSNTKSLCLLVIAINIILINSLMTHKSNLINKVVQN